MPSLYAKYLKEREGKETYETEEGFITYVCSGEECFIETVYVMPDFRKLHLASKMANYISELARAKGCKYLSGTVDPTTAGATESIQTLIAYGFKLDSVNGPLIILIKPL